MILFLLLISLLHSHLLSDGAPVTLTAGTAVSLAEEAPKFPTSYRSTIQIVWTCAAVIFASTWVCVHPNVPGYKSKRWERWGIRGRLFLSALLSPDQSVSRACKQWRGARSLYSGMIARRKRLHKENAKLAEWAGANLKRLGDEMTALLEGAEGLRVDGCLGEEVGGLSVESARLDAEWVEFRSLMAAELKNEKLDAGRVRPDGQEARPGKLEIPLEAGTVDDENEASRLVKSRRAESPIKPSPSDDNWTIIHAHFVQMGGVAFQGTNGEVWYKEFKKWTDDEVKGFFSLGLSTEDLQDRSKADALSKAFVIIQCLWFVVQCIGRAAFRLPLIELEVTSLAYIACNVGMYAFWWDKPLNVACPVVIPCTTNAPQPEDAPPHISLVNWVSHVLGVLWCGDIGRL